MFNNNYDIRDRCSKSKFTQTGQSAEKIITFKPLAGMED